jgi:hypothetical protein
LRRSSLISIISVRTGPEKIAAMRVSSTEFQQEFGSLAEKARS